MNAEFQTDDQNRGEQKRQERIQKRLSEIAFENISSRDPHHIEKPSFLFILDDRDDQDDAIKQCGDDQGDQTECWILSGKRVEREGKQRELRSREEQRREEQSREL
jgi:hypothetical protein